ncbi:hypothetical protein [Olleya marilimosa]|uniref:PH domain-containing protein n=1 Tax=Olleya marilimosa TaxID=272164 RepID=A0ABR8LZH2_9FLAO|nr:hypothetical protein [Olleya marilimosa]MBD3864359.1 hypothetical protein [Olleya marilimosa]MBD3891738.1 hypothetical protein [Olleya marilimosa]
MKVNKNISVKQAIIRGQLMVNVPAFICLLCAPLAMFYVVHLFNLPERLGITGVFLGIILAWISWSVLITKWRIWAFTNVRNVHALKKEAILSMLIWEDGTSFEKTEYRSKKDKLILKRLDKKFLQKDLIYEDPNVPQETKIYFSITTAFFIVLFLSTGVTSGAYLMFEEKNTDFVIGLIMFTICLFILTQTFKKLINRKPQLIINDKGITLSNNTFVSWSEIYELEILREGFGNSAQHYLKFCDSNYNYSKIEIDSFNLSIRKLENNLQTYQIRYNNNNKV